MAAEFVHLHVHSEYSLLDGAIRCKQLAEHAKALGMRGVALTDHGNMFGAIAHYQACRKAGITPIVGCEINVLREQGDRSGGALVDHLTLLAENAAGYRNLLRIVSAGHLQPVCPDVPSVTLATVAESTEGLIALSGCLGGVVPQQVLEHGPDAGRAALGRLRDILPAGSLYVELQDHGLQEQPVLNGILAELAAELGLSVVATNDAHFGDRSEGEAQLYLQCIATGRSYAEARAGHHGSYEMYLKPPEAMAQLFSGLPEALRSTVEIAERCAALEIRLGTPMLPTFPVPEGHDTASYFRMVAGEGLQERFREMSAAGKAFDERAFADRLAVELDIIIGMDFPGYFLIVWDFIRYAKQRKVPVGPGRGSGAGSLVAYALRITDLDPIEHGLLFERFLNPERVSMPDFDIDFCMDRRDEVIAYVAERYGHHSVGQIATFHELKARSVIKDVGRAMGLPATEAQRIANLIPQKAPGQMYTIAEALDIEPKLKALCIDDPAIGELIAQARKLEGLTRHAGMHAAGVVISEGPLWDTVPCFKTGDNIVTQYAKDEVEAAGLVKFDFLGLKTLTVIDIATQLIDQRPDRREPFDIQAIPLHDQATFALLQSGETTGVFQLESSGMQQLFKDLRPDAFEDIVAAVALYRPGPLGTGMVKDFVDCKHRRKPIAKMHPLVDDLLLPTYGVIVYQEQVMQIAQRLAGYTLGGADLLRRAMGKKKPEEMQKQRSTFLDGASANGVAAADAERIFGLLEFFAGYGFNKSHSAAYALLTYQTAYLKAHYPVELLCALMTADRDKTEKVVRIIAEGRAVGVDVLPPEINESRIDFTVVYDTRALEAAKKAGSEGNGKPRRRRPKIARGRRQVDDRLDAKIRFGLGAVRGVGESAVEALLEVRSEKEPFKDLFDVVERVDIRRLNRGVLEALVQGGAFDASLKSRQLTRAQVFASIDRALERGRSASKDREHGQATLFGLFQERQPPAAVSSDYVAAEPWDLREVLRREKEALGFYVSGHPLDRYGDHLARFDVVPVGELASQEPWSRVRVAGTVEGYVERVFRSGDKVGRFALEDLTGSVNVKVRSRQLDVCADVLRSGDAVLIAGKLSYPFDDGEGDAAESGPREPTLLLDEATLLSEAIRAQTTAVTIRLRAASTERVQLERLREIIQDCRGVCPVQLVLETEHGEAILALGGDYRVEPSDRMLSRLERLFGGQVAELR